MFQCWPISYFWNKNQKGKCIRNVLVTIGVTNGVLSFVGDLFILAMPIPMILRLQINVRRKVSLCGMFLLGGLVCLASIFRFVALARINTKDLTCMFSPSQIYCFANAVQSPKLAQVSGPISSSGSALLPETCHSSAPSSAVSSVLMK